MANPLQRGVRSERYQKLEGWIEAGTARLTQLMPTWDAVYAPQDPDAERVRLDRISQCGARGGLLTYSELAIGVDFVLPQCNVKNPYQIQASDWTGFDRRLIGDYLLSIDQKNLPEHGFMCSCLIVDARERKPSKLVWKWLVDNDVLPDDREDTILSFWAWHLKKGHQHFHALRRKRRRQSS